MENKSFSKTRFKSNFFDKISHFSTLNFNLLSNNMFTISRRDKQVSEISIVKFKKKKVENKINFDNRFSNVSKITLRFYPGQRPPECN